MQRKNSILRINPRKKRSGFAMIMAIAVIVVISTIMALSLSLTTETTKRTVDLYLYEQAELVAKSAVELTLLEIAKRDPVTNCLNIYGTSTTPSIPFDANITNLFDVNVSVQYVFTGAVVGCTPYSPGGAPMYITTAEQNGSVLMDVVVSTKADITTEPIRYFRRTIQKL
ncbi:hypothetical protein [Sulfurimonas sp.]|jgi:type II secretory pathway pseudopilin PulG|uniref:hypothetical protein n=1 Tax=Sulfurimonas sp. TaxID=2022749 RepID=UPI002A36472D|nr:hypothetical protein [Sulfurimonas sp.]MDY0124487.1 hypothetical protein [Sulfurimonas sp.]